MSVKSICTFAALCLSALVQAQKEKTFNVSSPDGMLKCTIHAGAELSWSVTSAGQTVLAPSTIAMHLQTGEVLGSNMQHAQAKTISIDTKMAAVMYKKDTITNHYNQLTLTGKGNYGLMFRAYDDGIAYRFFTTKKDSIIVQSEDAGFVFDKDYNSLLAYANDPRDGKDLFQNSFEAFYTEKKLSAQLPNDSIALLPVLVQLDNGKRAVITEAGLQNYPGMYMGKGNGNAPSLKGRYPQYPGKADYGGYHNINYIVTKRENYIAKTKGTANFPWRTIIIVNSDKELADNDMIYKLAEPLALTDLSWIKPGKVAWDWWNNRNITQVDFKTGINTLTYKYFIDFASANKLEYVVLDGGWSRGNLMEVAPGLDLKELISYGNTKGVGLILWSSWSGLLKDLDNFFAHYAAMGIKGFKIDFIDRDDQVATASTYTIAARAAQYHLLVDLHGMYKPEGLNHTYPNVVNYEGVKGLENSKWGPVYDAPKYDVTIPFIRMLAGPMDYTPGSMHNATQANFHWSNSIPMSNGTRCHQLAMYTIFEAPLQMLADNPTIYMKEQESTDFIAKVPTTFNETIALDGKIGEFVSIARRKGNTWFIGAMTNWDARDITIDLSFLKSGNYEAEIFQDGINADKDAVDYKKTIQPVTADDKIKIHMAPGGGWTARVYPINK